MHSAYATVSPDGGSYRHTLFWMNPATPDLHKEQKFEFYPDSVVPGPGGRSLH
jgi:hypothetical protein